MESELATVSNRADLERFIEGVRFAQTTHAARLAQLSGQVQAQQILRDLHAAQKKLRGSMPAASAASALLGSANDVGANTRSRVNDTLVVYERAKAAREMADQLITLRSSIQGIYGAMEVRDWERAAQLAHRARSVPVEITKGPLAAKMVPSSELPEDPYTTLQRACEDLAKLFEREFNQASEHRQMDQVTRHFKLFPLVGYDELGLELYGQFICRLVVELSRRLRSTADTAKQNPILYSVMLTRLFESVAAVIDQHSHVVTRHYGPDAMAQKVLPRVQSEVDKQAGLILETFLDERRIETLLVSCKSYSFPFLVTTFAGGASGSGATGGNSGSGSTDMEDDTGDLQEASARLAELGTMLNRWNLYRSLLLQKWHSDSLEKTVDGSIVAAKVDNELSPAFSSLSLFVFRRSVERAVQLDELPSKRAIEANPVFSLEQPLVSSAVDDTMYVFSNLLSQTLDAGIERTQLAAIAGFRRVLESDLIGALQRKLRASAPIDSLPSAGDFGGAGAFMIYLNDLEVCAHYVKATIERHSIPEGLKTPLAKFSDSFRSRAEDLLLDGCQTLASVRLSSQARQAITSSFKQSAYTTQVESGRCGATFRSQWHAIVRPLRQLLHANVLSHVLKLVLPQIAQQLERFIWGLNGKITEAGCMSLDRDISTVIAASSETQYSLRHHFVRLAQMVNALMDRTTPKEDLNKLTNDERDRILSFKFVQG